ncbi:MAG: YeiH family protein [Peptostreptococcaceae bacterium]|nr:YeiH family protein [Peptostreptococcaceae bacterium]
MDFFKKNGFGLLTAFCIAIVAVFLGTRFRLIGSAVFAILIGILYSNIRGVSEREKPGLKFSGKKLLQYSIIFLGFTMSFAKVTETGTRSLSITLVTIAISFAAALWTGKKMALSGKLSTLIGFGTAICGGSAIAAASPVVEADEEEIALSISTIFLFNIVAVFLFPFLGRAMGMDDTMFGIWAGTAINDTSSVVAAGYSYSNEAGNIATIVKLTRALMIVPSCILMAGVRLYKDRAKSSVSIVKIMPWFILWFLAASLISSSGLIPSEWAKYAKTISQWLMAMALAGIGSQVSFEQFKKAGLKPIITGAVAWFAVAVTSLIMQKILMG